MPCTLHSANAPINNTYFGDIYALSNIGAVRCRTGFLANSMFEAMFRALAREVAQRLCLHN